MTTDFKKSNSQEMVHQKLNQMLDLQIAKQKMSHSKLQPLGQNTQSYEAAFKDVEKKLNIAKERLYSVEKSETNQRVLEAEKENMADFLNDRLMASQRSSKYEANNNFLMAKLSSRKKSKTNGYSASKSLKKFQPFFDDSQEEDSEEYFNAMLEINEQKNNNNRKAQTKQNQSKKQKKMNSSKTYKSQSHLAAQVTNRLYSNRTASDKANIKDSNRNQIEKMNKFSKSKSTAKSSKNVSISKTKKKSKNLNNTNNTTLHYRDPHSKENLENLIKKKLNDNIVRDSDPQSTITNRLISEMKKYQQKTKKMEKQVQRIRHIEEELHQIKKGIDLNQSLRPRANTDSSSKKKLVDLGKQIHLQNVYLRESRPKFNSMHSQRKVRNLEKGLS